METIVTVQEELIEKCKRGDIGSFKRLYDQYARAMFSTSLRIVKNHADAEDVLQEAFIDIHRNLHQYSGQSTVGAWMKRIVINKSIDFLRKKKVHFEEIQDQNEFEYQSQPANNDGSIKLKVNEVIAGIQKLPPGYRTVLSLYLLEGYDHKEIAQVLQVSESTTRTQYIRAKKRLLSLIN